MGQVAAGGDSLPSAWSSLLVNGTRAAINLMPHSFRYHQAFSLVDHRDFEETCKITTAFLTSCQHNGDLQWSYLDGCIQVLNNCDDLNRFIPYDGPRVQYVASDSVLTLRNTDKPPFRHWETLWGENRQVWAKHISKSTFAVRDCGLVTDICAGLQSILAENDPAGGDPSAFSDHITFMSMMNEKRGDAAPSFSRVREALDKFSPGAVAIFGPGDADMWWPDCAGTSSNKTWQRRSLEYFSALTEGAKHPYIRGNSALSQLDLRSWISNAGKQCYDHHFQDTKNNSVKEFGCVHSTPGKPVRGRTSTWLPTK